MLDDRSDIEHHRAFEHDGVLVYDRLQIETTEGCNLRCKHCISGEYPEPRHMKTKLFNEIVDQAVATGFTRFAISPTVGDLSLDARMNERIEKLDSVGATYHGFTNLTGPWMNISRVIEGEGLDYLAISVYGHDRESFIRNTGVDGFGRFMENVGELMKVRGSGKSIHFVISNPPRRSADWITSDVGKAIAVLSEQFRVSTAVSIPTENWGGFKGSVEPLNEPAGPCVNVLTKPKVTIDGAVKACGCFDARNSTVFGTVGQGLSKAFSASNKRYVLMLKGTLFPSACRRCSTYTTITGERVAKNYDEGPTNAVYEWASKL